MSKTVHLVAYTLFVGFVAASIFACRATIAPELDSSSRVLAVSFDASFDATVAADWEKRLTKATIFIFRQGEAQHGAAPVVKYILSPQDIEQRRALIPMFDDFLVGQLVDIYAIVNSRDTNIYRTNKPYSRSELMRLYDSSAIARYNNSSFADLERSMIATGGFTMSGQISARIEQEEAEQSICIPVSRTVARIDVNVTTDQIAFRRYVTDLGQPNATVQIYTAWVLRTNRCATVFAEQPLIVDDYLPPYNRWDSLVQDNDGFLPKLYVGRFQFYTFASNDRGVVHYPFSDDQHNEAVKLSIRALYDADGNAATTHDSRSVNLVVPMLCGQNVDYAAAIERNTHYTVNVIIAGIGGVAEVNDFSHAATLGINRARNVVTYVVGGDGEGR